MATVKTITQPQYVLTLTPEETQFLFTLLGNHVGGYGKNRVLSDSIWNALNELDLDEAHEILVENYYMLILKDDND